MVVETGLGAGSEKLEAGINPGFNQHSGIQLLASNC
jgi:hypothetical protein